MGSLCKIVLAAIAICLAAPAASRTVTISFEKNGRAKDRIPELKPGDKLRFNVPDGITVKYQMSPEIGDGKVLSSCDPTFDPNKPPVIAAKIQVTGPGPLEETRPVRAIYFNLLGPLPADRVVTARRQELEQQLNYYQGLNHPLSWSQKRILQEQIAGRNDRVSQLQEEVRAFAGMSLAEAVTAINQRQREIRQLRQEINELHRSIDNADVQDKVNTLNRELEELEIRIERKQQLLRAGVLVIGENRKPVYYILNHSDDASSPWLLKRFQDFPVFTTDDIPYVVILGQEFNQDPKGLRGTFTSRAGVYIDSDPVRPALTQTSVASGGGKGNLLQPKGSSCEDIEAVASSYLDRVLQFTDRFAGETIYSLTVTGYGLATQSDTFSVTTGNNASSQHQTQKAMVTLKPLDGDSWPQVHSLYRYNLATGVLWTSIQTPSFSRVPTGNYLPTGCSPTTSISISDSMTGTTTSASCLPTYQTVTVPGGPRVQPALLFSRYWRKRDTQTKSGSWSWVLPVPTIGLSLSSPMDDFFLGGSSELPLLRNVQLVYGTHLGRVQKLGANSFQNPIDSSSPQTATSLHMGKFIGLAFNLDFIKSIVKK